jgi:hypothetical protein
LTFAETLLFAGQTAPPRFLDQQFANDESARGKFSRSPRAFRRVVLYFLRNRRRWYLLTVDHNRSERRCRYEPVLCINEPHLPYSAG